MKAIEQYIHVVLFIMLWKVVLTSESVDGILKNDHSNEKLRQSLNKFSVLIFVFQVLPSRNIFALIR